MAGELKQLLKEFVTLGGNYCANARKVVPVAEKAKLVDIYEAGLDASLRGLGEILGERYDGASRDRRQTMDRLVAASGALDMCRKANTIIGPKSIESADVLLAGGEIFEKIKTIIADIIELVGIPADWIQKLLKWIDLFIDNIGELFGGPGAQGGEQGGDDGPRRRAIRDCLDRILAVQGDPKFTRAAVMLREILAKAAIGDSDFKTAMRICEELLGDHH